MIKIKNLDDEKTQDILLDLGFFKREFTHKGYPYNIWIKDIKLEESDFEIEFSFLINTAFKNDGALRLYVGGYRGFDRDEDLLDFEIDITSLDNELDFLMQMFNSGLSIEIVRKEK